MVHAFTSSIWEKETDLCEVEAIVVCIGSSGQPWLHLAVLSKKQKTKWLAGHCSAAPDSRKVAAKTFYCEGCYLIVIGESPCWDEKGIGRVSMLVCSGMSRTHRWLHLCDLLGSYTVDMRRVWNVKPTSGSMVKFWYLRWRKVLVIKFYTCGISFFVTV